IASRWPTPSPRVRPDQQAFEHRDGASLLSRWKPDGQDRYPSAIKRATALVEGASAAVACRASAGGLVKLGESFPQRSGRLANVDHLLGQRKDASRLRVENRYNVDAQPCQFVEFSARRPPLPEGEVASEHLCIAIKLGPESPIIERSIDDL